MLKTNFQVPIILVAMMFIVFLAEILIPGDLAWLGIKPRSMSGLIGVVFSPFLHANIFHLISNALPILLMGAMLSGLNHSLFIHRTVLLIVASGLLTWLISSSGVVIGASGLVFSYWAYLIVNGVRSKKVKDIVMSVLTILIYGGLLISLFSYSPGISWAAHFSGAVAGAMLAWFGMPVRQK